MIADFLAAAWPWLAIGVGVAIACTYLSHAKKSNRRDG